MAQVDRAWGVPGKPDGCYGGAGTALGGGRGLLSSLRIADVPAPVLAALVCLMVVACIAGWALWGSATSGAVVSRSDAAAVQSSQIEAPSSSGSRAQAAQSQVTKVVPAADVVIVVVDVDGAVASPGVYRLEQGARVQDAVASAGGLTQDADTSQVNLAAVIKDGEKILIPRVGEQLAQDAVSGTLTSGGTSSGLVNINTADAALLDTLPGVGASTAQAIIDDREQNGPFASVEDLMRVSGIGEKKWAKMRDQICV